MTKEFEEKVRYEGIVDTRKYRYRFVCGWTKNRIERIAIEDLDTTAALKSWEIVKEY